MILAIGNRRELCGVVKENHFLGHCRHFSTLPYLLLLLLHRVSNPRNFVVARKE